MSTLHCENITFPSSDRKHTSSAVIYTCPDVPVRAVIQLSHGMCEYVRRYAPMADFYAAHGIALAGNDHLGHGDTAQAGEHGHYGEKDGRFHLLDDLHTMNSLLHERFPGLPIILYGHSMGSFYARWYAEKWPESITALIISGTAGPSVMNAIGQRLAALIAAVKGNDAVSPLMVNLNFGSYCKRIPDAASPNAWLSRDTQVVRDYDADKLCTFSFTAGTYREMLATLNHVSRKSWAEGIAKDLWRRCTHRLGHAGRRRCTGSDLPDLRGCPPRTTQRNQPSGGIRLCPDLDRMPYLNSFYIALSRILGLYRGFFILPIDNAIPRVYYCIRCLTQAHRRQPP